MRPGLSSGTLMCNRFPAACCALYLCPLLDQLQNWPTCCRSAVRRASCAPSLRSDLTFYPSLSRGGSASNAPGRRLHHCAQNRSLVLASVAVLSTIKFCLSCLHLSSRFDPFMLGCLVIASRFMRYDYDRIAPTVSSFAIFYFFLYVI